MVIVAKAMVKMILVGLLHQWITREDNAHGWTLILSIRGQ
ncbi:hypothetical protein FB472_1159 [Rhodoglobus vestalii]|uniref:Uncharacterized protein n=1 Tax=Rhodoglobus vestalii TaxID=193384 RepID=A0A8H2K7S2_9MICO|nr:hypothetical protein FB472_1159 [Rhodoglobus vestalii]